MLSEFVEAIAALARKSASCDVVKVVGIDDRVWLRHGDNLTVEEIPPHPRCPEIHGFNDFVAAVMDRDQAKAPEVYVSDSRVFAWSDRYTRRESISLPLRYSERFRALIQLQEGRAFAPNDAIKWLRFELAGAGGVDRLIAVLRRLDFKRSHGATSSAEHGRETLGRAVEAEVQGSADIPERATIDVPVWEGHRGYPYLAHLDIGIYLDVLQQQVVIRTLPDQIRPATDDAVSELAEGLRQAIDDDVPVFCGVPAVPAEDPPF